MWTAQKSLKLSAAESRTDFTALNDTGSVFPKGSFDGLRLRLRWLSEHKTHVTVHGSMYLLPTLPYMSPCIRQIRQQRTLWLKTHSYFGAIVQSIWVQGTFGVSKGICMIPPPKAVQCESPTFAARRSLLFPGLGQNADVGCIHYGRALHQSPDDCSMVPGLGLKASC